MILLLYPVIQFLLFRPGKARSSWRLFVSAENDSSVFSWDSVFLFFFLDSVFFFFFFLDSVFLKQPSVFILSDLLPLEEEAEVY